MNRLNDDFKSLPLRDVDEPDAAGTIKLAANDVPDFGSVAIKQLKNCEIARFGAHCKKSVAAPANDFSIHGSFLSENAVCVETAAYQAGMTPLFGEVAA